MEFDDSEFDSSDLPDRLDETGPPDTKDTYAFARLRAFLWLGCAVALVVGVAVGRLSAESNHRPWTVTHHVTTHQVSSVGTPGCPPNEVCRHYPTQMPALLSRLIALDFPDTNATEFLAVSDLTNRLRELVLTARLGRGLVLEETAFNRPPRRNTTAPWVLVAVGDSQDPDHAARTMTTSRGDATIHLRVAVAPPSVPERPDRADVIFKWCVRSAKQTEQASRLNGELDHAYPGLVAAVSDGVQALARSHVLAAFILDRQP